MRFIIAIAIVIASVAAAVLGRDYVPVGADASTTTRLAAQATLIVLLPIIAFVAAAVLTPPDPLSQLALAIPIIVLYEISIYCAILIGRRKDRNAAEAEEDS